ncbi:MAG: tetratricopeptide repeat protein, partial [Woeseia sp.]|nr:tetratricopeptide repeat protein [Woeseia sp.]
RTEDGMLTLAAYRELGGVEGSLAQRAETVFKDLPDDVEAELPKVLNALVSIERDGYEQVGRKRAPLADVMKGKSRELIETFVENRLFVTELDDDGSAVVTVAHEALLWHWPRVHEWVAQNRENLRIRSRLVRGAERWIADGRPSDLLLPSGKPLVEAESLLEHDIDLTDAEMGFINASMAKSKRFQRLRAGVVAALAVLGVVAAMSAYFATQQRDLANQARTRAEVEAETAKQTTEFMVNLFSVSDPSEARGNTITAREIMDKGAERIGKELTGQPATQATLMETIGTVYTSLGLYEQAAILLQQALDLRRQVFGENHTEVARTNDRMGQVLTKIADYASADAALTAALTVRRELLGDENLEVAATLTNLAELRAHVGEFEQAEGLLREALEIRTTILGAENMEVAQSLERLGLNLYNQGNYDNAETLLRESIAMRKTLLDGSPHPQLADGLNNLGLVLMDKGDSNGAKLMFQEALAMNRQLLDELHPTIAVNLNNLALLYHDSGEFTAAEQTYRDVIDIRQKALGAEHPEVALAKSNLAFLLYDKGDSEGGIAMQREAIEIYRKVFPDGHPDLASSLGALGNWLTNAGRYADAEPLVQESVAMRQQIFGDEHIHTAVGLSALAQLYLATGRVDDAREAADNAHTVLAEQLGEDHWRTAWAAGIEGSAMAELKQFDQAEKMLLESLSILRKGPGSGSRTVYIAITAGYLADLYQDWGRPEQAAEYRAMLNGTRSR